jgi:hypothetical protein
MAESLPLGIEYRDDDWPHGLRCSQCRRVLREPERYTEKLDGFTNDTPLISIVCLACAFLLQES